MRNRGIKIRMKTRSRFLGALSTRTYPPLANETGTDNMLGINDIQSETVGLISAW